MVGYETIHLLNMANPIGTPGVPKTSVADWTVREQLLLASAVQRSGDQNWVSVSRAVKPLMEEARPSDFFSQKHCAAQYAVMLDKASMPKRKRTVDGTPETVETVEEQIVRQLTEKRIKELDRSLVEIKDEYLTMKKEMELVEKGEMDDQLLDMAKASESASSKEHSNGDNVLVSGQQVMLHTLDAAQTVAQKNSEKPLPPEVVNELKVEIKQELLPPSSSQRNPVQPLVKSEIEDKRTSEIQREEDREPPQQNPDIDQGNMNQGETEKWKTEVNTDHGLTDHVQSTTEEPVEVAIVEEPPKFRSLSIPVEEEKMKVCEEPEPKTEHEEDEGEEVRQKQVASPESNEPHEHKAPAVIEPYPPIEVKQENDAGEENEEINEESHVPSDDELATTTASEGDSKPELESVTMETSPAHPEIFQPTPEKPVPVEEKQEEKEFSPSVNSPVKVEQESTEVAARKAPEGEHAEREEQKPSASRKEEKEEATEMDVEEGKEKSEEEKPSVKVEEEEEDVGQAPSPRITRARRREVSQTPEVPVLKIVKTEEDTPRGRRYARTSRRGRMSTRLSRQKFELAPNDGETSIDSRDVTDQESEEEPASSISSTVPSPALSQSDADQESLLAMRQWRKTIMLVWRHAAQHKYAALFLHPVKEEDAPGYHDVVLRPMDLSSIKKSIESGVIKTDIEFQREMLLMFQNALMYNSSDHDVYRMADEMQSDVLENIQEYVLTQMMVQSSGTKALRNRETKKVDSSEEKRKLHLEEPPTLKKRRTRADD